MSTFNPFNADGTWNWAGAKDASPEEIDKAYREYRKAAGLNDATEPPEADRSYWQTLMDAANGAKNTRSWGNTTGPRYGNGPDVKNPWADSEKEPRAKKTRYVNPVEEMAFEEWVRIENKGQQTRSAEEYMYHRWYKEGRHQWQLYGNDSFLWQMNQVERNAYISFRDSAKQGMGVYSESFIRELWLKKQKAESEQKSQKTWQYSDFYEDPWASAGRKNSEYGSFYGFGKSYGSRSDPPKDEYWKADHQEKTGSFRNYKQQLQYAALQKIMLTQFDMIASAYGEYERKRRRMEENAYRSENPVGVIKVVSTLALHERLKIKLLKEVEAGKCTRDQAFELLNKVYPEAEIINKQANSIAEFLLNPLTKTDYHECETIKVTGLR